MAQLHGIFDLTICEANLDEYRKRKTQRAREFFRKIVGLRKNRLYVKIHLDGAPFFRTRIIEDKPVSPSWDENFQINCAPEGPNVVFSVKEKNPLGALLVGRAYVPIKDLLDGKKVHQWYRLLSDGDRKPVGGRISVKLQFYNKSGDPHVPNNFMPHVSTGSLLHGILDVTIYEADLGEYRKWNTERVRKIFRKTVGLSKNRLYVKIHLEGAQTRKTRIIEDKPVNPSWNQAFRINYAHDATNVVFSVKEKNPVGALLLGRACIPVIYLLAGKEVHQWLKLLNDGDGQPVGGWILVKLQYFEASDQPQWYSGGIRSSSYPQREGCEVTLYQDAHVPDNFKPHIPLVGGLEFQQHRYWEDVFDAIENARHLIYITGWSVYTEITLIRDSQRPKRGGDQTLGELLKKKAEDGVRVLMLIWKDMTSLSLCNKDGLMGTHGLETFNYFQGTEVHCILCPRKADDSSSCCQSLKISTMFTHHQKIVITDVPLRGRKSSERQIVSFVGGIDLCDGRYDTPNHSLFRTLDSAHHADFHQPNFRRASIKKGGPREPWHDIHCKLEGQIAVDVLNNFEQRWRKQGDKNVLLPLENFVIPMTDDQDPETWRVQLFRSIDGGTAVGTENIVDSSIQDAYVDAIRGAKNFIYIESQYFLGSSFAWKTDYTKPFPRFVRKCVKDNDIKVEDVNALHLIPKELSLKIVSKIKAGEAFRVYVVLPMWPEGVPETESVQAILDWQRRTMEMMYMDIADALRAKGIYDGNPRDYLTFFCLANREVKLDDEDKSKRKPKNNKHYKSAQKNRRFMIYVHSKMMIVDDEYIIVGSANINQRSMDGARDSEIAMGAYQPHRMAKGQIQGFRISLWYEHTRMLDTNLFRQPQSIECIQKMNELGKSNWNLYSSIALEHDLPGHLLMYPVHVRNDGLVTELPGFEYFPDTKARVLGASSVLLPRRLTT